MPFQQASIPALPQSLSLKGQTAVLTGGTAGIGLELSRQLLRRGLDHLILGARNLQKAASTRIDVLNDREIAQNNAGARITVFELDLSSHDSVSHFANEVYHATERLDFVILSAGINTAHWETSKEGNELCFQVNVLSNFLLQNRLLPLVQLTSKSHYDQFTPATQLPTITWVGSMGQAFHTAQPGPPKGSDDTILSWYSSYRTYSSLTRYPDTKLFVAMITLQLASRLKDADGKVIINNICPGTVKTGADNNLPFYLRLPMNLNRFLRGRQVADGARAVFWAARGGLDKGQKNGFYVADNVVQDPAPFVATPEGADFADRLWGELMAECRRLDHSFDQPSVNGKI